MERIREYCARAAQSQAVRRTQARTPTERDSVGPFKFRNRQLIAYSKRWQQIITRRPSTAETNRTTVGMCQERGTSRTKMRVIWAQRHRINRLSISPRYRACPPAEHRRTLCPGPVEPVPWDSSIWHRMLGGEGWSEDGEQKPNWKAWRGRA